MSLVPLGALCFASLPGSPSLGACRFASFSPASTFPSPASRGSTSSFRLACAGLRESEGNDPSLCATSSTSASPSRMPASWSVRPACTSSPRIRDHEGPNSGNSASRSRAARPAPLAVAPAVAVPATCQNRSFASGYRQAAWADLVDTADTAPRGAVAEGNALAAMVESCSKEGAVEGHEPEGVGEAQESSEAVQEGAGQASAGTLRDRTYHRLQPGVSRE